MNAARITTLASTPSAAGTRLESDLYLNGHNLSVCERNGPVSGIEDPPQASDLASRVPLRGSGVIDRMISDAEPDDDGLCPYVGQPKKRPPVWRCEAPGHRVI